MKRIASTLGVFVAWAINTALGFWILVVARQALMSALAFGYVGDSVRRGWVARFWGQIYYPIVGLAYLIFIFVVDGYLKDGRQKHEVVRRFSIVAGVELLILFVADVVISLTQGATNGLLNRILLPVEGVLGLALVGYYVWAVRRRRQAESVGQV